MQKQVESLAYFSALEMEAICSIETFASPRTTTPYNSEYSMFCRQDREKFKSNKARHTFWLGNVKRISLDGYEGRLEFGGLRLTLILRNMFPES
jgi:hypothetical protein